jgi:hypothetical protein
MVRYRQSPQTFFDVVKEQSQRIDSPLDAYDFFYETYARTQKATLLEFMAQWPDIESLRPLDQTELAKHYCARMAAGFLGTATIRVVGDDHNQSPRRRAIGLPACGGKWERREETCCRHKI